jgi:hypothetical protein
LPVCLLKCLEYFWKRLLRIGDGLLNVWRSIANGASGAIDSKL